MITMVKSVIIIFPWLFCGVKGFLTIIVCKMEVDERRGMMMMPSGGGGGC